MESLGIPRRADCLFSPGSCNFQLPLTAVSRVPRNRSSTSFGDPVDRCGHGVAHVSNVVSHHGRPLQAKQRKTKRRGAFISYLRPTSNGLLLALLLLSLLCDIASGVRTEDVWRISKRRRSALHTLTQKGELLVDRSEPPTPRMRLAERDDQSIPSFSYSAPPSTSASATTRANATTTVTTSSLATQTATSTSSPLPQPFDTSLGNNFTSTCPGFFNNFLKNSTFQQCVPFSLLLQTSQAFFQASKSLVRITQVLDASCSVSFDTCNSIMQSLAVQLKTPSNCGTDFANNNPIVLQAYDGFISYQPMFQAGCQKDKRGTYCFADAITNSSSVADSYPYYLPLNMALAGGARPTCDMCLQETMGIFANAASNASQPISSTYKDAAEQINIGCGPDFVNTSIQVRTGDASVAGGIAAFAPVVTLLVVLINVLF